MRRVLPARPNLEHLKSQAKELLDAQRRGDVEAFARIRGAVPAFANKSDEEIAKGPFALHDAQSAIAREYGMASWADLRAKVAAAPDPYSEVVLQAMMGRVSPEMAAAFAKAVKQRGSAAGKSTPATVPMLTVRNSLIFPGALMPLDLNRPTSVRALEVALENEPAFIAMFAQRAFDIDRPDSDDLHLTGSLCVVRHFARYPEEAHASGQAEATGLPGRVAWTVVEGVRWVTLEEIEQFEPYGIARIADIGVEREDDANEIAALDRKMREAARRVADAMPPEVRGQVHAMIDGATDAADLADLVMAHLDGTLEIKAAYAEERRLTRRIERATAHLEAEYEKAKAQALAAK